MVTVHPSTHPLRVPKRKASTYADTLFDAQKKALAHTLVRLRVGQGLSQETLAHEAEVERSYVSIIERGQGNPSLRVLCQLAQRLGVSVTEMLAHAPASYVPTATGSATLMAQEFSPDPLVEAGKTLGPVQAGEVRRRPGP